MAFSAFFLKLGYQWGYPYKSMISTERHLPIDPRSQQSWWDQLIGGLFIIIYPIILLGFQQISTIQGGAAFIPSTVCSLKGELNCGSRLENLEFHPSGLGTGRGFLDFFHINPLKAHQRCLIIKWADHEPYMGLFHCRSHCKHRHFPAMQKQFFCPLGPSALAQFAKHGVAL